MVKRLIPALLIAGLALAAGPARATCVTAGLHNKLSLNLAGGVTITIVEDSPPIAAAFFVPPNSGVPNRACDDGATSGTSSDGYLVISQGSTELCRNDAVDPSFDPFYFGGGLDSLGGDCGAKFSAASIPNPLMPDVEGTYVDPDGAVYVGTMRSVITDVAGSYKVAGIGYPIPQDTTGSSNRGVLITGG
jgi:hypothetical protein